MAEESAPSLPFAYPVKLTSSGPEVTLFDAIGVIQSLYLEAAGATSASDASQYFFATAGSGAPKKMQKSIPLFTDKSKVVPGSVMNMTETVTFPSPQGMQTISRARIDKVFENVFLADLEKSRCGDAKRLAEYSYHELDEMRFALVAVADLAEKSAFDNRGKLTGLAKRDLKKNCKGCAGGGEEESSAPAASATSGGKGGKGGKAAETPPSASHGKGGAPQPAKLGAEERQLRGILLDECAALWPHTPAEKSAKFTIEQDKNQPKHKPLYRAVVELMHMKKAQFTGEWSRTKRDAENSAANAALRSLHAKGGKGK